MAPTLRKYLGVVYLWKYIPSLPAALIFAALFVLATVAHAWKTVQTRMWLCAPFVIGGAFEVVGYLDRAIATYHTGSLIIFLIQDIFLLLPPILFAVSLYMVYSRVVRVVQGTAFSPLSPKWTTIIFVLGDLTSLNIQSGGAGLLAKTDKNIVMIGNYIVIVGLVVQILMFALFMAVCLAFNMRFRGHVVMTGDAHASNVPWQSCLDMLYATSLVVLIRYIHRVIEYIMQVGNDGYLIYNEWPLYVFDGFLMLLVLISFFIWYPSHVRPSGVQLSERDSMIELYTTNRKASSERESAGKDQGRMN